MAKQAVPSQTAVSPPAFSKSALRWSACGRTAHQIIS
uniref:Uncharacterized protein n=1 Tax=Anguilla anguilla TaxID=7936 RepID=A0A0E9R0G5_ANGAN